MKAEKKFERGGYKFTATLNQDYSCEIVSDGISVEAGGFISYWTIIPLEKSLFTSIDKWILSRDKKTNAEIEFIETAKRHGYKVII
jgi:hypothetical protein